MITLEDIRSSKAYTGCLSHLIAGLERRIPGHVLEFGVWQGTSLRNIAERVDVVHGFDSFDGLPIPWITQAKAECTHPAGYFRTEFEKLSFPQNARIWRGWFTDTIPQFLAEYGGQVGLIHIDSDIYESARDVLWGLNDRIVPGTVIVFDELYDNVGNYDLWTEGEFKALNEWTSLYDRQVEVISHSDRYQTSVVVTR